MARRAEEWRLHHHRRHKAPAIFAVPRTASRTAGAARLAEVRRQRRSVVEPSLEISDIKGEIERWRRLFMLGEIDEVRLHRETGPLKRRLAQQGPIPGTVDIERAIYMLPGRVRTVD